MTKCEGDSNRSDFFAKRTPRFSCKRKIALRSLRSLRFHSKFPSPGGCRFFFAVTSTLMLAVTLHAAPDPPPFAELRSIFPPGAPVGGDVKVNVEGRHLDDLTVLQFSHPGLRGEKVDGGFQVNVSDDVPVGLYEVRARGRFGLSNPRPFAVSAWRESVESGGNQSLEKAHPIEIGQVISGRANERAYDFYRFSAEAGQRLLVECEASILDSQMDPVLVLLDAEGRELDRSRRSGLLDFPVGTTGDYGLKIYDFLYRGGADYFYRLTLHDGPYMDFILPPSGEPGGPASFTVYGRNLPGGESAPESSVAGRSLEKLTVTIDLPSESDFHPPEGILSPGQPADAAADWIEWRWHQDGRNSNPVRIHRALAPVTLENEPNDEPAQAMKVAPPCEVAGRFFPSRDRDWIEFEAAKDETWWIEIFSDRLGQPTDPFLLVQRVTKGEGGEEKVSDVKELYDAETKLGEREFDMDTRDAAWKFDVKESGTYRVMAQDLFHYAEPDPAHVYRLSVRRAAPDFRLVTVPEPPRSEDNNDRKVRPWHVFLRKGETRPFKVLALRRDDFQGEIELSVEGLPEGIRASAGSIPEKHDEGWLFLTAQDNGADWAGPVMVMGRATIQDRTVERVSRFATVVRHVDDFNNESIASRLASQAAVSASPFEPGWVRVRAANGQSLEAAVDSELEIPVALAREEGFDQNIKFKLAGHDALSKVKEWEVDGQTTNANWKINLKEYQVPPGEYHVALQGLTKGKYRNQPEAAAAAEEASQQTEASAKEAADAAQKASQEAEQAAQALKAAEELVGQTEVRLQELTQSLTQSPQDNDLLAAQTEADQKAADAKSALQRAMEMKTAAEQARAEAETRKAAAENLQKEAAERAKAAGERAKPRDVLLTIYSQPFTLKVAAPAPEPEDKKVAQKND